MLLKADIVSAPEFEAAGARRWTYAREGNPPVQMPYWSIPNAAYDDAELMAYWVRLAYAAADLILPIVMGRGTAVRGGGAARSAEDAAKTVDGVPPGCAGRPPPGLRPYAPICERGDGASANSPTLDMRWR